MFSPNNIGALWALTGRDVHNREQWAASIPCPFATVNLETTSQKTTVRADSSASRGAAEEVVSGQAKILVAKTMTVKIGDRFSFDDQRYRISGVHKRRSVFGKIDHFECEMEILP
jgi:hypothetical protein